jgi:hypothetical protein
VQDLFSMRRRASLPTSSCPPLRPSRRTEHS